MATIVVRGRRIRVQAKAGTQRLAVYTLYSTYTDERLDELEAESIEHRARLLWLFRLFDKTPPTTTRKIRRRRHK